VIDPVPETTPVSEQTDHQLAACTVPTFSASVPVRGPDYDGIFSEQRT
jgi:hypothetical protein